MKNEAFSSYEVPRTWYKYHINDIPNITKTKELILISEIWNKYSFWLIFSTLDSGEFIAYIQKLDLWAKWVTQAWASENLIPKLTQYIETFESKEIKFLYESIIESEIEIDTDEFEVIDYEQDYNKKKVIFKWDGWDIYSFEVSFQSKKAKGWRIKYTASTKDNIFSWESDSKMSAIEDMFESIDTYVDILESPKINTIKDTLLIDDSQRLIYKKLSQEVQEDLMHILIKPINIEKSHKWLHTQNTKVKSEPKNEVENKWERKKRRLKHIVEKRKEWEFWKEGTWKFGTDFYIMQNWEKVFVCHAHIGMDEATQKMSLSTSRWIIWNHIFFTKLPFKSIRVLWWDFFDSLIESIAKWEKNIEEAKKELIKYISWTNEQDNKWEIDDIEYEFDEEKKILNIKLKEKKFHINNIKTKEHKGKYIISIESNNWENRSNNILNKYFLVSDRDKRKALHKFIRCINRVIKSTHPNKEIHRDFLNTFATDS